MTLANHCVLIENKLQQRQERSLYLVNHDTVDGIFTDDSDVKKHVFALFFCFCLLYLCVFFAFYDFGGHYYRYSMRVLTV